MVRTQYRPAADVPRRFLDAVERREESARRPAILTPPEGVDLWLIGPRDEVKRLQRPLPDDMLVIVESPMRPGTEGTLL
jgi:hypothetical protein